MTTKEVVKQIGWACFWTLVSAGTLWLIRWVATKSVATTGWELAATALAGVLFSALVAVNRFFFAAGHKAIGEINQSLSTMATMVETKVDNIRVAVEKEMTNISTGMHGTNADTRALLMLLQTWLSVSDFFQSLMARGAEDHELARVLMDRVSEHVWRIPQAEPFLAYQVLTEALQCASKWEGIHASSLEELGKKPLDAESGFHFFQVLRDSNLSVKKRIIFLNREDFNAYRSPETLGEDEKKALLTTLSDVWEVTAQRVDCYFFNEDCLFNALHGLPYATATKLHSMRPWPDCAIYNDRYLVAYQRNGNSAAGNDHVLSISREGIIKIWTIDLEPRRNPDEDEERVARLAKGVRKIFDYLRSKEKGGGLEGAADNCFLPFKSVYERLRESTG